MNPWHEFEIFLVCLNQYLTVIPKITENRSAQENKVGHVCVDNAALC